MVLIFLATVSASSVNRWYYHKTWTFSVHLILAFWLPVSTGLRLGQNDFAAAFQIPEEALSITNRDILLLFQQRPRRFQRLCVAFAP